MFRKLAGQPLKSFTWDVMAIVVGLTLTFLIDEWRSEQKLRVEEIDILKSINDELEADIKLANDYLIMLSDREKTKLSLLETSHEINPDTLTNRMGSLLVYTGFMGNNSTHTTISAQSRNIISDVALRKDLQTYYSWHYGIYKDWEEYDKRLSVERLRLLREKISIDTVNTVNYHTSYADARPRSINEESPTITWNSASVVRAINTAEFRNHIYWSIHSDNVTMFFAKDRIQVAEKLRMQIDKHLENLK